ncbi:hypothetical protein I215_06612 [Galbibacter marinus]|uniref:Uncharacterized protein n=1 Tax=Galbibacter marinus TaxID=555500 RepID=K2PVS3_9FLAO|nr:hypothetical protein [Galbibacter marinus]EKF55609.1 hypothetical protein I215_06612 [Galbibacter marinus]
MQCKYNIDITDSVKFVKDLKTKPFVEIDGEHIWSLGYDTKPFDDEYDPPDKFPNCCGYHKSIVEHTDEWLIKFPNCCESHKKLKTKYWFKKENYKFLSLKVVNELAFTENFIAKNLESDLWYKNITDYIEYSIDSFGIPNIGGDRYLGNLKHWLKSTEPTDFDFPESKRSKLLEFIDKFYSPGKKINTDLNILHTTFQKWLKTFPDLPFFKELKEKLKGKIPFNLLLYETNHNRFTGLTKAKIRTQSELIEILINSTKNLLGTINTPKLFANGLISDKVKYQIDLLNEQHKVRQNQLLIDYSKNEVKYVKIIKKWLKNERLFLSELKPIIKNYNSMPKLFTTEKREAFDKPYLKVFLRDKSEIEEAASLISSLQSVRKANVTDNAEKDITVYPAKTYSVDEMIAEIDIALDSYLTGGTLDPVFEDKIDSLSEKGYEDILTHIRYYGKNLEKFKKLYDKFDEEGFREFFLPHLNSISKKHSATGETFNKIGKTDILIQDENGINVFIAECKLWKGELELLKAVDQLLERYVTWRDEKVALIIFNKDMKKFSELLTKASKKLTEHPLFDNYIGPTSDTSFRYLFKHPDDNSKKVYLELIVFNCI